MKFKSNIELQAGLEDNNAASGSSGQILSSTGNGVQWINQGDIEVEKTSKVVLTVKNVSGGTLSKGTVVHAAPTANPPSGNVIEVVPAENDVTTSMPAIGVLNEQLSDDAEGEAVMFGRVSGIDTSAFSIGDELFVSDTAGTFTSTKPTGTKLIQKIAVVIKVHATNGTIEVFGAGRTNDVPTPLYVDHANQRLGIGTASPESKLQVQGDITIKGFNTSRFIRFSEPTNSYQGGFINYDGDSNIFYFGTHNVSDQSLSNDVRAFQISRGSTATNFNGNLTIPSYIYHTGDSNTFFGFNSSDQWKVAAGGNVGIQLQNTGVYLYYGGNEKLRTTSAGVTVTGEGYSTGGWGVGTGQTSVGKILNSSGVFNIRAETGRQISFGNVTNGEAVRIDSSGNVGIGTTLPSSKLDVVGDTSEPLLTIKSSSGGTNDAALRFYNESDGDAYLIGLDSSEAKLKIAYDTDGVSLNTNTRVTLDSSGKVGIGTTTPKSALDVAGGVKVANDSGAASADKVGTLRYRTSGNNSYVDICMQTGASAYAWVNIVQNNW